MKLTESLIPSPSRTAPIEADTVPPRASGRAIPKDTEGEEYEEIPLEDVTGEPIGGNIPKIAILGQERAQLSIQGFVNEFCLTGEFPCSILMTGPAGVGKSFTVNAIREALDETGKQINHVDVASATEFAVITSDASQEFISALKYSARGVHSLIVIDEAQLISKCGSAMRRILDALLYGSGQGWKRSGSVPFNGKNVPFNTRFLSLILITNQPEKVMKGNREAFERRFKNIELQLYPASIMRRITREFFNHKGIKVEDKALTQLEKIHRGTLEALCDFLSHASGHFQDSISVPTFEKILPLCKFTHRGFKVSEVKALKWIATTKEPRTKGNLEQNFPDLDTGAFYRHCIRQETKVKGKDEQERTPFLCMERNEYRVTEQGTKWLAKQADAFADY